VSDTDEQWLETYINGVRVEVLRDTANGVISLGPQFPSFAIVNTAADLVDAIVDYFWIAVER
jgi:hypothetical protein